jgi:hypothetical protein
LSSYGEEGEKAEINDLIFGTHLYKAIYRKINWRERDKNFFRFCLVHLSSLLLPALSFFYLISSITLSLYVCMFYNTTISRLSSCTFLFLFLSVLYRTVGTFLEHYLADTDEYKQKKEKMCVSSGPGKCNDDNGRGRRRKRSEKLLLSCCLLLLFSSTIRLRTRIAVYTNALLIKIIASLFSL